MNRRSVFPERVGRLFWLVGIALAARTYRHYYGPPLPPSERSAVEGESHFYLAATQGISITSVDK